MRRRDFIAAVGGAAVVWPLAAPAQQAERLRRIGVLLPYAENDSEAKSHLSALTLELERLGWSEGRTSVSTPVLRPEWQINIQHSRKSWLHSNPTCSFQSRHPLPALTAGDARDSDRVYRGLRPGRLGFRRQFGATRGQSHRHDAVRVALWEVAPDAQRDRTAPWRAAFVPTQNSEDMTTFCDLQMRRARARD